jgi:transposase InsO family protein
VKRHRNEITSADLATWPEFNSTALAPSDRATFNQRRAAIELYAGGETLNKIEDQTHVNRRQLYRLIERCTDTHADGRPFGFRGLVRYARVAGYERVRPFKAVSESGFGAAAGAFGLLLQSHPELALWIKEQIKLKRITVHQISTDGKLRTRLGNLKHVHSAFISECRKLKIRANEYPFNTDRTAIRALSAALRAESLLNYARASHLAGASHLKGLPTAASPFTPPAATQFLDVVEFDGHRLDLRLKVVVKDPLGFEQHFEIERIWLLVIIDVWSRAVLGYHVSLNREYSRYDVIRTIEAALEPHRPMAFTLPGVGYGALGGFPSGKLPELGYATWQWFKLDNAKANLSNDVRHALGEFIGCMVDAGPPHTPDDRPYIERFFGSIAANLSSRLPGHTGSHPKDIRRALSDTKGNARLHVSLSEITELLEAAMAIYNASPHDGLNGRTPLEAVEHCVRTRGTLLNWLPDSKRRTLCLMQTPKRAIVRGYLHQGQRPHINFYGVRYTNATLASTATFLGQEVHLYYNSQDLRTVRAFTASGAELGVLTAQGAWGVIAHDLKLRQEIVKLRGRKKLASAISQEFMQQFIDEKFAKAKGTRRAASSLAQTLQTLAGAPTSLSATMAATEQPRESPAQVDQPPPPTRIEPQRLSIGTGYAGAIWPM